MSEKTQLVRQFLPLSLSSGGSGDPACDARYSRNLRRFAASSDTMRPLRFLAPLLGLGSGLPFKQAGGWRSGSDRDPRSRRDPIEAQTNPLPLGLSVFRTTCGDYELTRSPRHAERPRPLRFRSRGAKAPHRSCMSRDRTLLLLAIGDQLAENLRRIHPPRPLGRVCAGSRRRLYGTKRSERDRTVLSRPRGAREARGIATWRSLCWGFHAAG